MNNTYEPGDIKILKIELLNPQTGAKVDIRGQIAYLAIFEDIEEPSMMLEAMINDSVNLAQDFPIIGEEIINITYVTPARENPTRLSFNVFSIEGTNVSPTSRSSMYFIKAVSPIHLFNAFGVIEKTYNTIISEMVEDILKTAAGNTEKKNLRTFVEKTKGMVPVLIPSLAPFEAVDFLRQKAVSAEFPSGGAFVFFENQYGIQFRSIEGLLKDGKTSIDSKKFTYYPGTGLDKSRQNYAFRNLLNYVHLNKFDTIDKIQSGSLSTEVESFDLLTKDVQLETYKLSESARLFTSTENKSKLPNSNQFINRLEKSSPSRVIMTKDTSKGNDFIDATIGLKSIYANFLNQNGLRALVYGDNYLSVGDVVEIKLPETSGTTEKKTSDRLNSGNYLITKLRHQITIEEGNKPKHYCSFDCVRIGYK